MTVEDLISELRKFPPYRPVLIRLHDVNEFGVPATYWAGNIDVKETEGPEVELQADVHHAEYGH